MEQEQVYQLEVMSPASGEMELQTPARQKGGLTALIGLFSSSKNRKQAFSNPTAFTLLKSRRFSVNSFNECSFIHHTDESYSVFSSGLP
ncbi:hypothetical protein KY285_024583 [Solanum tuberosum]|nr:hypothetical protein KY285_024583 [Solanum tuberosum]